MLSVFALSPKGSSVYSSWHDDCMSFLQTVVKCTQKWPFWPFLTVKCSAAVSTIALLCNHQHFSVNPNWNTCPLQSAVRPSPPQATMILPHRMCLTLCPLSKAESHNVLLWMPFFNYANVFKVHPCWAYIKEEKQHAIEADAVVQDVSPRLRPVSCPSACFEWQLPFDPGPCSRASCEAVLGGSNDTHIGDLGTVLSCRLQLGPACQGRRHLKNEPSEGR